MDVCDGINRLSVREKQKNQHGSQPVAIGVAVAAVHIFSKVRSTECRSYTQESKTADQEGAALNLSDEMAEPGVRFDFEQFFGCTPMGALRIAVIREPSRLAPSQRHVLPRRLVRLGRHPLAGRNNAISVRLVRHMAL